MATILIVDDDDMNRDLLQTVLKRNGFDVIYATNGKGAFRQVSENRPDLMLLDVRMADMTGYEVCAALKGDPATADIPIIILTAHENLTEKQKALDAGANDFLSKMAGWQRLIERVRLLLPAA
jgi:CheY-like chemotaxis protein